MPFSEADLIAQIRALSPSQLSDVAAFVKSLSPESSQPVLPALSYGPNPPIGSDLFLSLDAARLRIQECEPPAAQALGTDPTGRPFLELIDAEYRDAAEHAFAVVRSHKEVRNVLLLLLRADGGSFPVTMAARWVDTEAEVPPLIDLVCRDISFLKRLGNIEVFSEMLSIGIAMVDEHGVITFANTAAERMFGYAHGELTHQPWQRLFPESSARIYPPSAAEEEVRGRKKDGSGIAVKMDWSSIRLTEYRFAVASITDLTVHKSIEGTLRKHEEQRALIFSGGLVGDFSWNLQSDQVEAHPTVFRLYGAAPITGPVPGSWFKSRRHPDDMVELKEKWFNQLAGGDQIFVEFRVIGDDGVVRWIECRGLVVRDQDGMPVHVHGLNIDVTARKKVDHELSASETRARNAEDRLRTAVQFSSAVVWRWHIDHDIAEWFGPLAELTGKEPADLKTASAFNEIVYPADLASLQDAAAHSYATGSDYRHEFRIVLPGGQVRWLAARGGVLRDAAGRIYGMTGVNFDITERKTIEQELRESERDFRQLTNFLPQIVFTANGEGVIEYHNERFYQLIGLVPGPNADLRWAELLHKEDRDHTAEAWLASVTSGRPYEREFRIWDRHFQQYRWYLARATALRNADGATVRWIGTSTDIHDQKTAAERLENEVQSRTLDLHRSLSLLRQREEQLKKSLLEKDALLREIHHRVKNNLQIVSSLLSMQASNATDSAAVAALRDSERRIASMAIIHEQLYRTADMQTVDFAQHTRSLAQSLQASLARSPLVRCDLDLQSASLTIHKAIPCALILNELLTNAFKYAYPDERGGQITIRLSVDSGFVSMRVSDQGVGLPAGVDPFFPKTLGMEIIQVLVNQLEGELVVGGPPGASFTVRFRQQENSGAATSVLAGPPC